MKKILLSFIAAMILASICSTTVFSAARYGHVYRNNSGTGKRVALTFDDGPHPRYTEKILDILEEYGVTATFFIIGVNAENYPDSLDKIIGSGCEIGNHTYSHPQIDKITADELYTEMKKCEDVLYEKTGQKPKLFRPPQGKIPSNLLNVSEKMGYSVVLWSIDTLDWSHNPSGNISATVMRQLKGGDIILMHDYISGINTTCDALRLFIPKMLSEGYEFVTVSELIGA